MCGAKKKDKTPIEWNETSIKAFEGCKEAIREAAVLAHPKPNAELVLACDASNVAMGAVLQQKDGDFWKPLGFFSRNFNLAQRNYATYDRELLAIHQAIRHFRPYIEGRNFVVWTDHKPLTFAFQQKLETSTPLRIRLVNYISQFTTEIRHISGTENDVADAFSRLEEIQSPM